MVADFGLTALLFGLALFGAAVLGLDLCRFEGCECSLAVASKSGDMSFPACNPHLLHVSGQQDLHTPQVNCMLVTADHLLLSLNRGRMMSHRHRLDVCTLQHACRQKNSRLVQQHMVHLLAILLKLLTSQAALLFVCVTLPVQLQLLGSIICVHCYPFCKLSWNTKGSACHLN